MLSLSGRYHWEGYHRYQTLLAPEVQPLQTRLLLLAEARDSVPSRVVEAHGVAMPNSEAVLIGEVRIIEFVLTADCGRLTSSAGHQPVAAMVNDGKAAELVADGSERSS